MDFDSANCLNIDENIGKLIQNDKHGQITDIYITYSPIKPIIKEKTE